MYEIRIEDDRTPAYRVIKGSFGHERKQRLRLKEASGRTAGRGCRLLNV